MSKPTAVIFSFVSFPWLRLTLCAYVAAHLVACSSLHVEPDALLASSSELSAATAYTDYIKARLFVARGEVDRAHAALTRALQADSDSVYLRSAQASLYLEQGKQQLAYLLLTDALRLQPDHLMSQLLLADLLVAKGDGVQAMTMFHRILDKHPDMEELYLHLSRLHLADQDYAQATAILTQMLERRPDCVSGLLEFARLYRLQGDIDRAKEVYRQIIELYPDQRRAYVLLGRLYEKHGELDAAFAVYEQAAQVTGDNFHFDHLRSSLLMQQQCYDTALAVLNRLLEEDPSDVDAHSKVGLIRMEQQLWHQAEQAFRRALALQPAAQLYYWLAYSLEQQEEWSEATKLYLKVEAPLSLKNEARERLSLVYSKRGDFSRAASTLERLIKDTHGASDRGCRARVFLQLALYYQCQHRSGQVLAALKWGIEHHPQSSDLHYALGIYHQQHGNSALMEQSMRRTIEVKKDHAGALNHLAYTYAEEEKHLDEALQMAVLAVAINPSGASLDTLGWVYFKLGRFEQARTPLEQAVAKIPHDLLVKEHLGDIYHALNLDDLAGEVYALILNKSPDNAVVKQKLEELCP